MSFKRQTLDSPIGPIILVEEDEKLVGVIFEKNWSKFRKQFSPMEAVDTPLLRKTREQLGEYFRGERRDFDLPLQLTGTDFQNKVWSALGKIPFGQTRSYKDQAVGVKRSKAVRAVGQINGANPLCVVLPCHRVIGSDGSLTGYGGGLPAKRFLLKLEQAGRSVVIK